MPGGNDDYGDAFKEAKLDTLSRLAEAYKQINAPRGELGRRTLTGISTRALEGGATTYTKLEERIVDLTNQRNALAAHMIAMLEAAAFDNKAIDEHQAERLIDQANDLLGSLDE
jgi:hypothetical protein